MNELEKIQQNLKDIQEGKVEGIHFHSPGHALLAMLGWPPMERDIITSRIKLPPMTAEEVEEIRKTYGLLAGYETGYTDEEAASPNYSLRYFSTLGDSDAQQP